MIVDLSLAPKDSLESNILSLKRYLTQIKSIKSEEDIIFDLSKTKWSTPLFITPLSCIISRLAVESMERGFGLSTTTDLLTNSSRLGGEMVIISGSAGVLIKPTDKYKVDCSNWGFKGTIINLRLPRQSKMTSKEFYETVR